MGILWVYCSTDRWSPGSPCAGWRPGAWRSPSSPSRWTWAPSWPTGCWSSRSGRPGLHTVCSSPAARKKKARSGWRLLFWKSVFGVKTGKNVIDVINSKDWMRSNRWKEHGSSHGLNGCIYCVTVRHRPWWGRSSQWRGPGPAWPSARGAFPSACSRRRGSSSRQEPAHNHPREEERVRAGKGEL